MIVEGEGRDAERRGAESEPEGREQREGKKTVASHRSGSYFKSGVAPRPAGPPPRDGLQRARQVWSRASAGGAPAPRRPAARTSSLESRLGRRGPRPATACSAHVKSGVAPRPAGPPPRDGLQRALQLTGREVEC